MGFKVGLLGLGTVGAGTVQILQTPDQRHPLLTELEIHKVGVRSLSKARDVSLPSSILTTDLASIVNDPEIDIIVEVMGGIEPARELILTAIANGKHIVTANKALIAKHSDEIFSAAEKHGVYVLLEAAVGGGIPVIEPLKQSLCSNRIQSVMGIINGTTNYILTRMVNEGAEFADVLTDAQRLPKPIRRQMWMAVMRRIRFRFWRRWRLVGESIGLKCLVKAFVRWADRRLLMRKSWDL